MRILATIGAALVCAGPAMADTGATESVIAFRVAIGVAGVLLGALISSR